MQCPKCKIESAHRSHRVGVKERLISLLGFVPYRCRQCSLRFVAFRYAISQPDAPPVRGAERDIAATRGSMRWRQRRRELLLYGSALAVFAVVLYYLTRAPSMGG